MFTRVLVFYDICQFVLFAVSKKAEIAARKISFRKRIDERHNRDSEQITRFRSRRYKSVSPSAVTRVYYRITRLVIPSSPDTGASQCASDSELRTSV